MRLNEILIEGYIAFELDKKSRQQLKALFPPKYDEFIGHHITYKFGVEKDAKIPKNVKNVRVVGYADDGEALEALVVEINGSTTRPDGKVYHITWSLDRSKGRKPVHSNNLIQDSNWSSVEPTDIKIKAKLF